MKSGPAGKATLDVEITNIDMQGVWLLMDDKEYFLPFERFPCFRDATVREIHNVQIEDSGELHWPDLKVRVQGASLGTATLVPAFAEAD
jgi:hypothetical protein